jgi:acetyl esterase
MALEPRVRRLLPLARRLRSDDRPVPMAIRRERAARQARLAGWTMMLPGPKGVEVDHTSVSVDGGHIPVRLYRPDAAGPLPLYVFLHGGGWCQGGLDERDPRCRTIASRATCVVASVDYRMAPENQFPTAPEDCFAAVTELVSRGPEMGMDPDRVAIGGESAGANLAAAVCLMARDRDGPRLCHQWLDVPATDVTLAQEGHHNVPDGYLLDAAQIDEYLDHYLPDPSMATDPRCSPLLADDLSGLPPAWIMSAGYDRLRGDAVAFAEALGAAGVPVRHTRLAGHIHTTFAFTRLLASARAYEAEAITALADAFASRTDPSVGT